MFEVDSFSSAGICIWTVFSIRSLFTGGSVLNEPIASLTLIPVSTSACTAAVCASWSLRYLQLRFDHVTFPSFARKVAVQPNKAKARSTAWRVLRSSSRPAAAATGSSNAPLK